MNWTGSSDRVELGLTHRLAVLGALGLVQVHRIDMIVDQSGGCARNTTHSEPALDRADKAAG